MQSIAPSSLNSYFHAIFHGKISFFKKPFGILFHFSSIAIRNSLKIVCVVFLACTRFFNSWNRWSMGLRSRLRTCRVVTGTLKSSNYWHITAVVCDLALSCMKIKLSPRNPQKGAMRSSRTSSMLRREFDMLGGRPVLGFVVNTSSVIA